MTDEQKKNWDAALDNAAKASELALEKWGEEPQLDMLIEECSELITAIQHYRRHRVDKSAVRTELADVLIMVFQAARIFGIDPTIEAIEHKAERTRSKVLFGDIPQ
jgi:NTP pyrophosphatase (non-canonical NTP hydrolase)